MVPTIIGLQRNWRMPPKLSEGHTSDELQWLLLGSGMRVGVCSKKYASISCAHGFLECNIIDPFLAI